jgi:hypothetical protein
MVIVATTPALVAVVRGRARPPLLCLAAAVAGALVN